MLLSSPASQTELIKNQQRTQQRSTHPPSMICPKLATLFAIGILLLSKSGPYNAAALSVAPKLPRIIQGGMGVRISSWNLARTVAQCGELGVISGTCMEIMLVRSLQKGDPDGAMRRALATFPDQDMVSRLMEKYFIEGGKAEDEPYKQIPMWSATPQQALLEATVMGTYAEIWLAKHNDDSTPVPGAQVGMNLLTKIQMPTIPALYGAMLAGVDYILMGAGIPMAIPGYIDNLAQHKTCEMLLDIEGKIPLAEDGVTPIIAPPSITFSPQDFWASAGKPHLIETIPLKRPNFLPIVSSVVLAQSMLKRASGAGPTRGIQGFVIELPTAGGHNAPPRGFRYDAVKHSHEVDLNDRGEPVYGPKDEVDLLKFGQATQGLPFWLAGSYGRADKFAEVLGMGAQGVQVGTAFALSKESGMSDATRQEIFERLSEGDLEVFTDPVASPTGFPFKVLDLPGTLSDKEQYLARPRVCNLGYLRAAFVRPDGKIGYRCPSEPVNEFIKKGGDVEATEGRKCLCNALCADAGYPQVSPKKREGETTRYVEQPLVTIGDDVNRCRRFMKWDEESGKWGYSAKDVIDYLLSEWNQRKAELDGAELVEGLLAQDNVAGGTKVGAGKASRGSESTVVNP